MLWGQQGNFQPPDSKITNEKGLILLALKKMSGTTESERWISIKLEELIIERLMKRQKHLETILG